MILSYYVPFLYPYQFHLSMQTHQRIFLTKYVKDFVSSLSLLSFERMGQTGGGHRYDAFQSTGSFRLEFGPQQGYQG